MPPKRIQGTIIVLDVGRNACTPNEKQEKSFFENAKECTSRIIERKIMSQGSNLMGIMLLGSKNTKNNIADQHDGAFRHIAVHAELQEPTWQIIRQLPETGSTSRGDWGDGLLVAADYFRNVFSGVKLSEKKIILMTNFQKKTSLDASRIEQIIEGLKNDNVEVDVIGPDIDSEEKNEQFKLARMLVKATNGVTATFEYTMSYLLFHKKKDVNPALWNVDLSIGPSVKIPVSSFVRIKDEPAVKNWRKAVKDPITCTSSTTEAIIMKKGFVNPENQQVVDSADKVPGHNYGHKIIPFSACDKKLLYEAGEKCLSVYGFTDAKNISLQAFDPDGLLYVSGRKDDKKAQLAIRCLAECLHELNLIAIARKVHNTHNAPKMFALMPVIDSDNDFVGLSMAIICFKDDIKQMSFPSTNLKKYECSNDQVNAWKELIAEMDLTKAYDTFDDAEAFPIAETVSPSVQYILDCIAYRALNPGKPLPEPRDEIMSLFRMPPLIEKRSKEPLEKLKKLFVLNKVEVKTKKIKGIQMDVDNDNLPSDVKVDIPSDSGTNTANMPKIQLPVLTSSDDITNIGTVNPVGDFKALMDKNKALVDLTPEMIKAIESLIYSNLDGDYSKALDAMLHLRIEHLKADPTGYNNWVPKLKLELNARKNTEVLNLIKDKGADVILNEENALSTFKNTHSHEDSQLYENDTLPNSTELTIRSEINDIFDEM